MHTYIISSRDPFHVIPTLPPPHLQVVVADAPFVDLMNTMSDPTVPLTAGEWEEWGNPNEVRHG